MEKTIAKKRCSNPYFGLFKMNFLEELQYRAAAISGLATQFVWGAMYVLLYAAFYRTGNAPADFNQLQMASYIWLGQAFFVLRYVGMNRSINKQIITGDICYHFIRPMDLHNNWFATMASNKYARMTLRFAPIIIIAILLPAGFGLSAPVSWAAFLLFVPTLAVGSLIAIELSVFATSLSCKTLSPKATMAIVQTVSGVLGGMYIPIPLMPKLFQTIISFLPFRYISDLPYRIYCGNISITNGLIQFAVQVVWFILLVIFTRLLIKNVQKNVEVQGG